MQNIKSIDDIRKKQIKLEQLRKVDIAASIAAIENCYFYLQMNNLDELHSLKAEMISVLKELKGIAKNG